jgi:hypothetical protein
MESPFSPSANSNGAEPADRNHEISQMLEAGRDQMLSVTNYIEALYVELLELARPDLSGVGSAIDSDEIAC